MAESKLHAPIATGYCVRVLIIALALIGGGAWFAYDGWHTYPEQQAIYQAHEHMRQEHADWRVRWQQLAAERGWPTSEEDLRPRSDTDILVQRVIACILLPLGLIAGIKYLEIRRRWITLDDDGLHTNRGAHVPWDAITSLDKSRWQRKGIAVVHYGADGRTGRVILDDWKHQTQPIEQMVRRIEAHLNPADTDAANDADADDAPRAPQHDPAYDASARSES